MFCSIFSLFQLLTSHIPIYTPFFFCYFDTASTKAVCMPLDLRLRDTGHSTLTVQ